MEWLLNSTEGFQCTGAYGRCDNIIDDLRDTPASILLMDIEMPGMSGIEATRLVKMHYPSINILIQTVFFDDDNIFQAICAGAAGYILKSATLSDFIQAIKDVDAGGSPMTPGIARKVLAIFKDHLQPKQPTEEYNLSRQEKRVLDLLTQGKSYKMIAAELVLATDTVKRHMTNIYKKLHVHSGTEAVALALKHKII